MIITTGRNGILLCNKQFKKHFPSFPIDSKSIVNTNGAGDNVCYIHICCKQIVCHVKIKGCWWHHCWFVGGTIAGLLKNKSLEESVKLGLKAAYTSLLAMYLMIDNICVP